MPFILTKKQQIFAALGDIAVIFPVFLIIFTWRGFFQALIAKLMGDDTAKNNGFLTINPLVHIDFLGLLVIIGVFFFIGGLFYGTIPRNYLLILLIILGVRWTVPVPIDERLFKHYKLGGILTSLAGPFGNFVLAFIAVGMTRAILWEALPPYVILTFLEILRTLVDISLFFCILDLLPIPPFDGGKLLRYILPVSAQGFVNRLEEYSLFILLALFILPGISDVFLGGIASVMLITKKAMLKVFF